MRRSVLLLIMSLPLFAGCETVMHNMQPHRLWRWNYYDAPGRSTDGLYSVPDRLATPAETGPRRFHTERHD